MTVYSLFGIIGVVALLLAGLRYFLTDSKNLLITYLQQFVGVLFIFSGFVKAIDPVGTGYKMHEYFEAFSSSGGRAFWEFIAGFATPFSVIMIVLELVLGIALLVGWSARITTVLLLLMTIFFTFLTGYTFLSGYCPTNLFFLLSFLGLGLITVGALMNKGKSRKAVFFSGLGVVVVALLLIKFSTLCFGCGFDTTKMKVTDCGCFGDFMKLKPWETFYKDIILDVMILILAFGYEGIKPLMGDTFRGVLVWGSAVVSLFFCLYNFVWNEPVIDFRAYAIGNNIAEERKTLKPEIKDYVFVYHNKKTNETKNFKTSELTGLNMDEWEYKDRKDIVLDPGIPAKINNLFINDADNQDVTDSILNNPNYSLMVVAWNLKETHECCFKEHLNPLALACDKAGIKFFAVTHDEPEAFRHKNQTAYPFYQADDTPLKTIMRSNPGLVLLKNGVVVNKWHYRHFPTFEQLNAQYFKK